MSQSSAQPLHIVYGLTPSDRGTRWIRIGVAFINRDGSETVYLDAVPLSGKLQIREESRKAESEKEPPPTPENET